MKSFDGGDYVENGFKSSDSTTTYNSRITYISKLGGVKFNGGDEEFISTDRSP